MFDREELVRAIILQEKSYSLLKWIADAVTRGFIRFSTAHKYTSFPKAASAWHLEHYLNIPQDTRIEQEDLEEFCLFFTTYLENSFNLDPDPGK